MSLTTTACRMPFQTVCSSMSLFPESLSVSHERKKQRGIPETTA